jgi:predicted helicase
MGYFCNEHSKWHKSLAAYDANYLFPLYLNPDGSEPTLLDSAVSQASAAGRPNHAPQFISDFSTRLGMEFIPDGKGAREKTIGLEDIFNYAYAVLHSPIYRQRYAEFLKIDFPRLPLTGNI